MADHDSIYIALKNYLVHFLPPAQMALVNDDSVNRICNDPNILQMDRLTLTRFVFTQILKLIDNIRFSGNDKIEIVYERCGTTTLLIMIFEEHEQFQTTIIRLISHSNQFPIIFENQRINSAMKSVCGLKTFVWDCATAFSNVFLTNVFDKLEKGMALTPRTSSASSKRSSEVQSPANGRFLS